MAYYYTIGVLSTAATNTYTAMNTGIDGGTVTAIQMPSDARRISMVGGAFTPSATWTVNTANVVAIKLSGAGLMDGDQEIVIGAGHNDETGASVTREVTNIPATYQRTNIRVRAGNPVFLSASYNGTDSGTQVIVATLEVS